MVDPSPPMGEDGLVRARQITTATGPGFVTRQATDLIVTSDAFMDVDSMRNMSPVIGGLTRKLEAFVGDGQNSTGVE